MLALRSNRLPRPRPACPTARPVLAARYTAASGGGGGGGGQDRFAECVLFSAPSADRDDAGAAALSPASRSVLIAILEKGVPFRHALVSAAGASEFDDLFSAVNPMAPRPSPPLLADCGAVIAGNGAGNGDDDGGDDGGGATVLLEYLCERYRAVGTPLLPSNPGAAATVRLFSQVFSEAVARPFRRLLRAAEEEEDGGGGGDRGGGGAAAAAAAHAQARREFLDGWRRVDAFLLAHGGGATAGFDALDAGAEMLYGAARGFVVRPPEAAARAARAAAAAGRADDGERDEGTLEGGPEGAAAAAGAYGEPAVDWGGGWGGGESGEPAGGPAPGARPPPEGAYLLGRAYSLAEVAATPLVARMAARLPLLPRGGGGLGLAAELRREGLGRSAAWCEACLARPSAVATAATADEMVGGGGGIGQASVGEWARAL